MTPVIEYHKIETLYERDEVTHRLKIPLILKNRVYGLLSSWIFTEKIDGTNIRCVWKDGKMTFGGKTDNAQIHADLIKWLYENISPEKFRIVFPDASDVTASNVVLYGEGYGAGIQKGGGDYSETRKMILFDVAIFDPGGHCWWLNDENMRDVAGKFGIDAVPLIGAMTLEQASEYVQSGFRSQLNGGKKQAEGMVGRPIETLYDKRGHRLIVKLKTKDFPDKSVAFSSPIGVEWLRGASGPARDKKEQHESRRGIS